MRRRQFLKFCVSGGILTCVDYGFYFLLLSVIPLFYAKFSSYVMATIGSYFLNKYWTFEKRTQICLKELLTYISIYAITSFINASLNFYFFHLTIPFNSYIPPFLMQVFSNREIAFVMATAITLVINFSALSLFLFKTKSKKTIVNPK